MAHWVPTYSEKGSLALKELAGPGSGMIRWQAEGVVQRPLGELTITGSLRMPDVDTTNRSLNPDLWIQILQVMLPDDKGLMTLRKSAQVNRAWKGHAGVLLDPGSKWQEMRAAAMEAGDAQLKTLLSKLSSHQTQNRCIACMKDLSSMWDLIRAFSSEPTLQETAAKVLIVVSETSTLTDTDAEVIIQGHGLTFVECRYMLYNSLVTALVRHAFLQTPWGSGLGGCINDAKAYTVVQITQAIRKLNQASFDHQPKPTPEASGQEILHARNSHVRLLTLLHDILLAQYRTSVPAQTRTPHRLMMWSCASLLLDILSASSRHGKHRESSNRRTFPSLPQTGTDKMETAEQHYGLAAILPAPTEFAEKRELWAAIFLD